MLKREFSWSYTRHLIFERCHRAYYYHYYASWGGWDMYASEKSKFLYRLKNMNTIDSWSQAIFYNSLKKALTDHKLSQQYLHKTAIFQMHREAVSMKSPSFEKNPKNRLLKEISFGEDDIDSIREKAGKSISLLIEKFTESPAHKILQEIDPFSIKTIPEPSCFILNGIKIWSNPDFLWTEKGVLKILNLYFKDPMETELWEFKATLDMMLAEAIFPGNKKTEVSSFFLLDKRYPEITIFRNRKEVKSLIDKSCRDMLELTNLDTDIREELFEQADNDVCQYCNFNKACLSNLPID